MIRFSWLTVTVKKLSSSKFNNFRCCLHQNFSKIKLVIGSTVVDLKKLDGGGEDHSVFDYDSILKPCGSSYPRGSHCGFDRLYDLYTNKVKPHYSLFSGHVVKYNVSTYTCIHCIVCTVYTIQYIIYEYCILNQITILNKSIHSDQPGTPIRNNTLCINQYPLQSWRRQ